MGGGDISKYTYVWYAMFSCFDLVILYTCTCKCASLTSQKRERWLELINNSSQDVTNLFHIGLEHSIWLAVVARQHKNNGATLSSLLLLHVHIHMCQSQANPIQVSLLTWNHMHATIPTHLLATNHSLHQTVHLTLPISHFLTGYY